MNPLQPSPTPNVFNAYTASLDEKTRQFMEEATAHSHGNFPLKWIQTFIRRLAAKDMELQDREQQLMNLLLQSQSQYPQSQHQQYRERYTGQRGQHGQQRPHYERNSYQRDKYGYRCRDNHAHPYKNRRTESTEKSTYIGQDEQPESYRSEVPIPVPSRQVEDCKVNTPEREREDGECE